MGAILPSFLPQVEDAAAVLEAGRVVIVPGETFVVRPEEKVLLTPALLGNAKNISLCPSGVLKHVVGTKQQRVLLQAMMSRFSTYATKLVEGLAPRYRGQIERARTSFRPAEIETRKSSVLQDDTRLHVDAFPAAPMRGRRILRAFANLHPDAPRIWNVGEPFADMALHFVGQARIAPAFFNTLRAAFGLTNGIRAPYDDVMLTLHDSAKRDETYQARSPRTPIAFPPGAVWLCFTDVVMHAAVKGQFALEQSFHLPVPAMADPARAPLRILERMIGRQLV